jgi:MFS family permease
LVFVGLYVRWRLAETPAFQRAMAMGERVRVPMATVFCEHTTSLLLGTVAAIATFVLFYVMTVFSLSWGTSALHYARKDFLWLQMLGVLFFAGTIPLAALVADRRGRWATLIAATIGIILFGLVLAPLFASGNRAGVIVFLVIGLALMGLTYGPLGTALAELFPTAVRYTGASLTFNLAGIFGASLAPYVAMWLARRYGLPAVGMYLSLSSVLTLVSLLVIRARSSDVEASGRSSI